MSEWSVISRVNFHDGFILESFCIANGIFLSFVFLLFFFFSFRTRFVRNVFCCFCYTLCIVRGLYFYPESIKLQYGLCSTYDKFTRDAITSNVKCKKRREKKKYIIQLYAFAFTDFERFDEN